MVRYLSFTLTTLILGLVQASALAADTLGISLNPDAPAQNVPASFTFTGYAQTTDENGDGSVGRVAYAHSRSVKRGDVIRLGSGPGTHLRHGAQVLILVSSGRRRHH